MPLMLALDLATVLGWAAAPLGTRPASALEAKAGLGYAPLSGTHQIAAPGSPLGPFGHAYQDWLRKILKWLPAQGIGGEVEVIVFEAPILPPKTTLMTVRKLHGLCLLTEVMAHASGRECFEAERGKILRHLCGHCPKGRKAQKWAVWQMCRTMGWDPEDDNAADALAILDYSLALWNRRRSA